MIRYPAMADLIPHASAMILVDRLTRWSEGAATCTLTVRERAPFVNNGTVESAVTIEYMAQTVAACLGYEALRGGGHVRVGMIIACKRFVAYAGNLSVNDALVIDVKRVRGNEILSHFDCTVRRADALYSEATLTLYHAEKPPEGMS